MIDWSTLGLFVLTEALLSLTPGPAVLLVVGLGLRHGFQPGFEAALGVVAANAVYFALSAAGVGALILASATLFTVVKWIGAVYLAYLGLTMLAPLCRRLWESRSREAAAIARAASRPAALPPRKAFRRGFVVQASNPKNIAFFVAILPQFVTPGEGVAAQLLVLGAASILLELPILMVYAAASARSARFLRDRIIEWIEGLAGGLLVGMGGALALYRRGD